MAKQNLKIIILGDGNVGKTCLFISYRTKQPLTQEYLPTVCDNYKEEYFLNDDIYAISLWDLAGQEEYEKLRVLSYPNTDCFILCYAINGKSSFINVKQKWLPELRKHRPHTPIVLVATKCDLRNVDDPNPELISIKQGLATAKAMKFTAYLECSAWNMTSIEEVVETGVKACLKPVLPPLGKKKRTCTLL